MAAVDIFTYIVLFFSGSAWVSALENESARPNSCYRSGCLALFVQSRTQKFAGLEEGTGPARDVDRDASSRVPARARLAMPDREGTEATYLDPTASRKCFAHHLENGFNNALDLAVLEMWVQLRHPSHQFRLRHDSPPSRYARYYNESRTHLALRKDALVSRSIELLGRVIAHPVVGGLHHRYARI